MTSRISTPRRLIRSRTSRVSTASRGAGASGGEGKRAVSERLTRRPIGLSSIRLTMRQADSRDAGLLFQIEAHQGLRGVVLPVRKPSEYQQARPFDLTILSFYREGPAAH